MDLKVIITNKKTGLKSEPVDIMKIAKGENIDFIFPDKTTLSYNDFSSSKEDYEIEAGCIFNRYDDDSYITYECSNCGELWIFEDGTPEDNQYNYCPKCGTKIIKTIELEKDDEEDK